VAPGRSAPGCQLHIAAPDAYQPAAEITAWEQAMTAAGAAVQVFRYQGAGHLFSDPGIPDFDRASTALAWERTLRFLSRLLSPALDERPPVLL
jgi:dienelactone hydrolase